MLLLRTQRHSSQKPDVTFSEKCHPAGHFWRTVGQPSSTSLSMRPVPIGPAGSRTERVTRWQTSGNGVACVDEREFRVFFPENIEYSRAKKRTSIIRPKRKLHYRKGVPFGISTNFPIGTGQVSFDSIRSRESIFRFGFVKK